MSNQTIQTPAMRARFLSVLSELGNVTETCRTIGVGRAAIYTWRAGDADFAAAWTAALELGTRGS